MLELLSNYAYEVVIVGVVITVIGSLTGGIGAYLAQKKSSENQKVLLGKNEEIAELNKRLTEFVTGGNNFCYVSIPANNAPSGNTGPYAVPMVVLLQGKTPVYDVFIRVNDNTIEDVSFDRLINNRVHVGTVSPGEPVILPYQFHFMPQELRKSFNLFITTRNGFFVQTIDITKINDRWESKTRVSKHGEDGNRVVFEETTPGFPS